MPLNVQFRLKRDLFDETTKATVIVLGTFGYHVMGSNFAKLNVHNNVFSTAHCSCNFKMNEFRCYVPLFNVVEI